MPVENKRIYSCFRNIRITITTPDYDRVPKKNAGDYIKKRNWPGIPIEPIILIIFLLFSYTHVGSLKIWPFIQIRRYRFKCMGSQTLSQTLKYSKLTHDFLKGTLTQKIQVIWLYLNQWIGSGPQFLKLSSRPRSSTVSRNVPFSPLKDKVASVVMWGCSWQKLPTNNMLPFVFEMPLESRVCNRQNFFNVFCFGSNGQFCNV